jgi:hypothetical protein
VPRFLTRCFTSKFLVFFVLFSFLSPLFATEVLPPVLNVEISKNSSIIHREEWEATSPLTPHHDSESSKNVDDREKREVRKTLFPTTPETPVVEKPVVKKDEKEPSIKVKVVSCGHGNFNIIKFHLPDGSVKHMVYDAGTMNIDKPFKFTSLDSPPRPLKKSTQVKQQKESQQGSESSLSQEPSGIQDLSPSPTVKDEDEDKENRTLSSPVVDPKTPERKLKPRNENIVPTSITRPYSIKKVISKEPSEDDSSFRSDETFNADAFLRKQSKEFLAMPQTMVFSHNNKDHLSFGPRLVDQIRANLDSPDAFVPHIILSGDLPWKYNLTVGNINFYDWLIDQREKGSKIYFPTVSYDPLSTELLKTYKTKPESVVYAPQKFAEDENDRSLFTEAFDFGHDSFRVLPLAVNPTHFLLPNRKKWMRSAMNESNRDCMVLKVACEKSSMIFTGDADDKTFEIMLANYSDKPEMLRADVVHIPHHGSAHENKDETKKFYQATGKGIRIASCAVDLDEETYENAKLSAIQVDPVHKVTLRSFSKLEDLEGVEEQVKQDSKKNKKKKKDKKTKEDAEKEKKELKKQAKDRVFTKTTHTGILTTLNEGDILVELHPSKEDVKILIKDGTTPVTPYKGQELVEKLDVDDEDEVDEDVAALLREQLKATNALLQKSVEEEEPNFFDEEEDSFPVKKIDFDLHDESRAVSIQQKAKALLRTFDENSKNDQLKGDLVEKETTLIKSSPLFSVSKNGLGLGGEGFDLFE